MAAIRPIPHAIVVTGGTAQGRSVWMDALTAALVCTAPEGKPCMICPACRKAAAGIHPDVASAEPERGKREVAVARVRALRSDAYIKPNEAPRKVYRFPEAQRLNPAGQNALLKVLEDGPDYAAFLLSVPYPTLLLPTVLSRCEAVRAEEEDAADKPAEEAAQLASLLLGEDELAAASACAGLEKRERDAVIALLDALPALLLQGPAHRALPACEAVRRCRLACERSVGTPHIMGFLAAQAFLR